MHEKVQYWINMAEYDLETAKVMLKGRRFLYVGFMCINKMKTLLIHTT